jgi:hypothetical protein
LARLKGAESSKYKEVIRQTVEKANARGIHGFDFLEADKASLSPSTDAASHMALGDQD